MSELDTAVAVVGLAVRVPGAADAQTFWKMLADGRVSLPAALGKTDSRLLGGQIDRLAEFDAELFGVQPAHAAATDPQHRVLTELVWQALEDAGLDTQRSTDRVGVFVGSGPDTYLHTNVLSDEQVTRSLGHEQIQLGNSRDFLATALSYRLGFTGPSITVQTACSTSLVAVHQAVRSLLTYECDVAIAGGATIHPLAQPEYQYTEGGIVSPDGRCRTFTEGSQGTVPSSGAGVVVLRRATDADRTGAPARALIVGSAVNNDGADRMSMVAPSPHGQAEVIREALETAGLTAADIGLVEAHGTGTTLGDQVELSALSEVYGAADGSCALGAVKPNIGHCDTAAGVIGLIKTVLALEAGVIPPTPSQPGDGPDVQLGSARFFVPRQALPWAEDLPRRGAVSSFGLGGTNAHVLLAATAAAPTDEAPELPGVAVLSAATPDALRDQARRLADWLDGAGARTATAEVLGTLWHGRRQLRRRWAVALPADETLARDRLRTALADEVAVGGGRYAADEPSTAVLLPGQGVRLAGVGTGVGAADPEFAADLAELRQVVFKAGGPDLRSADGWPADDPRLLDTAVVQPMLFTLGLAALRLLERRGVRPQVLLGHSVGELTAATHAGVFSLADGAAAVVRRGRLMAEAPSGTMMAIRADETTARELCDGLAIDVSGLNGPDNTVLGGDADAIAELERRCRERSVSATRLATSHAFHSRAMGRAAESFTDFLRTVPLAKPDLRVVSNLTGEELTPDQATDPGYWGRQLRGTVRLDDALGTLLRHGPTAVVGLHRGRTMTNLARQSARRLAVSPLITDLLGAQGQDEAAACEETLAQLWTVGCPVRLAVARPRRRTGLPGYPFAATRHWVDALARESVSVRPATSPDTPENPENPQLPPAEGGPDDAIPAVVTGVWQRTFGGAPLQPDDNFFALGGTSLQAAHLITVVNDELLLDARLQDLYEHSSLRGFITRIAQIAAERDDEELLRLLDELEAENGSADHE
jgi:acyl transferase domain-containing protein